MRFTTKHLLIVIGSIALVMATLAWVHRSFGPNPSSERFTLLESTFSPRWQCTERKKLNSTVVATMSPLEPRGGYNGSSQIQIDQKLFDYQYRDFFGNNTYRISHSISGHASEDWTDYYLLPTTTGGGNVGASAEITTRFDSASLQLTILVHQQFANTPGAKTVTIPLYWDGSRFAHKEDTEPSDAPKPPSGAF